MLLTIPPEPTSGSAGGDGTLAALRKLDEAWLRMRTSTAPPPPPRRIVTEDFAAAAPSSLESFDVVVCGGNLGILLACALLLRGLTVAVIEAGELRGRAQDWNASRKELHELVRLGVLTADELEDVVGIEFNPMRVGFVGGDDVWLTDVLNVGVKPQVLLETVRQRFERGGGKVFERSPLASVVVHADGAVLSTAGNAPLRAKLVLDCMGQRSPIVSQLREGAAPDGVCVVVGTCARGYEESTNVFGDIIFSDVPTMAAGKDGCRTQYFWEAFPASSGARDRTTYLFTYMDLEPERPSVEDIFEDYWKLLPSYQGVDLEALTLQRALFGLFVSYRTSPLAAGWDRVLQVGDASGVQSPLSFGGFGALMRHMPRVVDGVSQAIAMDDLSRQQLSRLNTYTPNLQAAWLFQKSMRPPVRGAWSDDFISRVLVGTFDAMLPHGDAVLRPFLQDVLRVDGLALTIGGLMLTSPVTAVEIVLRLGPLAIADWSLHFAAMCAFTIVAAPASQAAIAAAADKAPPARAFALRRWAEACKYGSGLDFEQEQPPTLLTASMREEAQAAAARMREARAPASPVQV